MVFEDRLDHLLDFIRYLHFNHPTSSGQSFSLFLSLSLDVENLEGYKSKRK